MIQYFLSGGILRLLCIVFISFSLVSYIVVLDFLYVKLEDLNSLTDKELPYPFLKGEHFHYVQIIFLGKYYKKSYRHYYQRQIVNPNQLNFRF